MNCTLTADGICITSRTAPDSCHVHNRHLRRSVRKPQPNTEPNNTACFHRGEQVSTIGCSSCGAGESLPVFDCSLHEECTVDTKTPGVKWCGNCADRNRTPEPVEPVDILMLGPDIPAWHLREKGFAAIAKATTLYHGIQSKRYVDVRSVVKQCSPKAITVHCFALGTDVCKQLAIDNPDRPVVSVCHSSQAHLATSAAWLRDQARHLQLSRELQNYYYATPDERQQYAQVATGAKCLWWPNPVRDVQLTPEWPAEPVAAIIGRWDVIKNTPTQIAAVALAGIKRLQIVSKPGPVQESAIRELCDAYGLDVSFHWFEWKDHLANIARNVTMTLQSSFSESFNYVAVESLLCGKPVIGSPAVRYLPRRWQPNPDDASAIAKAISRTLDDLPAASGIAVRTGQAVAERQNTAYRKLTDSLVQWLPYQPGV